MKLVAIVGRTNVGKSTLFNRLIQKRFAVTSSIPKTTRDSLYAELSWGKEDFIVVDTAGIDLETGQEELPRKEINDEITSQIKEAISEADLLVFVVDSIVGLTPQDKDIADIVRRSGKPVVLACNKADNLNIQRNVADFDSLGFKNIQPVSAISGKQSGDLLDRIVEGLKGVKSKKIIKKSDIDVCILGRPNVGKSTLINKILGKKRVIVSDIPGTTIDSVDVFLKHQDKTIRFIDTAGIRRRGKIKTGIEKFSVLRALKSISRSDIVVLVTDGVEGITKQDMHIAQFILESGKGLILAINKWDLAEEEKTIDKYLSRLRSRVKFLPWSPVVFISAMTGKNIDKIMEFITLVDDNRKHVISTKRMNQIISQAVVDNPPRSKAGKEVKVYYSSQVGTSPPLFMVKVNNSALFHFSYIRYLERKIREEFDYTGTPITITFRSNK